MKCEELDLVLDAAAPGALAPLQKEAVDAHLASCAECRSAWAAYRELAATEMPAAPRELRARVTAALAPLHAARPRRVRRAAAVGVLVVGAAAATIALQLGDRPPAPPEQGAPARTPLEVRASAPASGVTAPVGAAANGRAERAGAPISAALPALDPFSIAIVAVRDPALHARAAAWLEQCQEQVVQQLRAIGGLNVIAGERVSPYLESGTSAEQIAVELGAGSALIVGAAEASLLEQVAATRASLGLDPSAASCRAQHFDARTGTERWPAAMLVDPAWQREKLLQFVMTVADNVRNTAFGNAAEVIAVTRAAVLDAALSDRERVAALARLRQGPTFSEPHSPSQADGATTRGALPLIGLRASVEPIPGAFDDAVVAAAVQIGTASADVRARQIAWAGLRGVHHPYAVQGLLTALAGDADENVRRAAALALGYVVDEPGVRTALRQAAAEDRSTEPPIPCCIPSVRGAAMRALQSDAELRESALRIVLDATLPTDERLRPLYQSVDGRAFPVQLSEDAARAVFDIGRAAEDAMQRSRAWTALRAFRNDDFVPVLLDDLARHPIEGVRAAAAAALQPYAADPVVGEALERAQTDSAASVRSAARSALDGR